MAVYCTEALELSRHFGDQGGMARLLILLGIAEFHQGDVPQAKARFIEGLRVGRGSLDTLLLVEGLAGLAQVAAAEAQPERAARLFGAAHGVLLGVSHDTVRPPMAAPAAHVGDSIDYELTLAAVRSGLQTKEPAAAHAAGQAMSLQQAVAYAVGHT
jgi:non-specific serine/threonine protein kinase